MKIAVPSESRASSLPDSASGPEEQEFSDEDDRNHKHCRRETSCQSKKGDQEEQYLSRPYRKWSKPFDKGHLSKESNFQPHYGLDREFPSRFEKRRLPMTNFSRFPSDGNPSFSGDLGSGRGRIRDSGSWSQHDARFNQIDIAFQMVPPGLIPPAVFSSTQNASWGGGYGLIPGMPKGAIDPIHPIGLQGSLRSPLNPSLNIGIAHQRCRDFDERGFCLRGETCPMEHGVNRIVIEDVQSLSEFNLPGLLPSAHLLGNPAGGVLDPQVNASPGVLINKNGSGIDADSYALSGAPPGMVDGSGADLYDPDQPLWNNDCPQTSTGLVSLQTPASFMESDPSDHLARNSGLQSTISSGWGKMNSLENRLVSRDKVGSRVISSGFLESRTKEMCEVYSNNQTEDHHGRQSNTVKLAYSSSKRQNHTGNSFKKTAQKAIRSLYIYCIPRKDNRKEALLSHFKKFGEVTDIYIRPNTDQAFIQFSKREEAERALKSPDAVMGNRFIKLLWANRDGIIDAGGVGRNNMAGMPQPNHKQETSVAPDHASNMSKENIQLGIPMFSARLTSSSSRTVSSEAEPPNANGPKTPTAPPVQKKLENLELLKEELRKKQELLEQRRKEFRQQLDKLEKNQLTSFQATGMNVKVPEVQASKKLKVEGADVFSNFGTPKHSNLHAASVEKADGGSFPMSQPVESATPHIFKTKFSAAALELSNLKHVIRPLSFVGSPYPTNRYKLDNRPTSFRVEAPLPTEFANVDAIRHHFALFGHLSNVDLEISEVQGDDDDCSETSKNISARVSFKTRQAADMALINGKSWNGHSLQFTWLMPTKCTGSPKDKSLASKGSLGTKLLDSSGERGSLISAAKEASGTEIQSMEKPACDACSCGGNQSSAPGLASFSGAETQSVDKSSAAESFLEASGPGSTDFELVEKEGSADGEATENPNLVTGGTREAEEEG